MKLQETEKTTRENPVLFGAAQKHSLQMFCTMFDRTQMCRSFACEIP